MRNCFGNLAKFIVVVTNLIVFIVGCVSTGFGTYCLVTIDPIETDVSSEDSKDVVNYYNTSDNQRQHLIVATSFSAVVAVVSLFGCIGAWKV